MEEELGGKAEMAQATKRGSTPPPPPPQGGAQRRKGIGVKAWMVVSETGETRVEEVEKHWVMKRTGLPARDLRVLDPVLSHPSSILGRERAIVVNLEHIKAIVTAKEILMISSNNPLFLGFLQDLKCRLPSSNHNQTSPWTSNGKDSPNQLKGSPALGSSHSDYDPNNASETEDDFPAAAATSNVKAKWGNTEDGTLTAPPKQLPFEFKALEACLESACRCLESETQKLEEEAYPALDELTSQISTLTLERVRQIKSRLVALSGRVQKVKDQVENLLDDDNDMAEMYLTQKLQARSMDRASARQGYNPTLIDEEDERDDSYSEKSDDESYLKLDVEELEMLLEAYFAQINGILQKLSSLSEYVDDTQDYINISLDDKQNQLLQVAVIFNLLNMILNAGIVVVGLFGMNIHIELFDGQPLQFWTTTICTFVGCVLVFLVSVWWGKKRYLFSS